MSADATTNYEIWRRVQAHREAELVASTPEADRLLAPLVLSLARLAAQRETRRKPANAPTQNKGMDLVRD